MAALFFYTCFYTGPGCRVETDRTGCHWRGGKLFFSDSGHSSPVEGTIYDYLSLCKAHWFMNIHEMHGLPYCCPSTRLWLHLVWEEEVNIKVCWWYWIWRCNSWWKAAPNSNRKMFWKQVLSSFMIYLYTLVKLNITESLWELLQEVFNILEALCLQQMTTFLLQTIQDTH